MKIIHIKSEDDDYAAMNFQDSIQNICLKTWEEFKEYGQVEITVDDEETIIEGIALEFKDVDPKFIAFIQDYFMDYDMSKQTDFFVVKE